MVIVPPRVNLIFKCKILTGAFMEKQLNQWISVIFLSLCLFIPECYYVVIRGILMATGLTIMSIATVHTHAVSVDLFVLFH